MKIKFKQAKTKVLNPAIILEKIYTSRTVYEDGRIGFTGFGFYANIPILKSMIEFPDSMLEVDQDSVLRRALTIPGDNLSPNDLIAKMNQIYSHRRAIREQKFFVLTTISTAPYTTPKHANIENAKINFYAKHFPKKFSTRSQLINNSSHADIGEPEDYTKVVIEVVAKTPHQAFQDAMTGLDLIRAFWCFLANPSLQIMGNSWEPINKIRLGGVHTVHMEDGSLATEQYWYEPNFIEASLYNPSTPTELGQTTRRLLNKLSKCSYKKQVIDALLRYVRSLDEKDQNVAFIRIWSALESLVIPGTSDYDSLIRRCSFVFSDNAYHRQALEHLRLFRNRNVHSGDLSEDAKNCCFQVQMYVRTVTFFLIGNHKFFDKYSECIEFLDLAPSPIILRNKLRLLNKAIKYLRAE